MFTYLFYISKLYYFTFKHMAFAPRACFFGYHELFAFISGSFQENS